MPDSLRKSSARKAYSRQKDRARRRSARITQAGQEIGALPPPEDLARRSRADADFRFFCETYFPHLFTLAWSQDHLRVIGKIERVVRDNETLAVAMPRGSGKTTLCLTAVQWAILSGRHAFEYLIASTNESALAMLANIKSHLAGNDMLLADYPEAVYPVRCLEGETRRCNGQRYYGVPTRIGWGVDEVILPTIPGSRCSGSIIRVSGITGNIRGALHTRPDGSQVRPSLVVCDDPQTDQSARSIVQTAERLGIVNGAISGLAGPGQRTAIIIPCTVIQHGDLADQLLDRSKSPSWHGERTKLIYRFPEADQAKRLWAEYAKIREESLRADGDGSEATAFYAANREQMDEGCEVSWPERYLPEIEISALQHAMNLRLDRGDAGFFAEYQNEPIRPSDLSGEVLTLEQVCAKASGRPRGQVPLNCTRLTMFVDVHDRLLYWCLCGWEEDFAAGHVIDYGTFPEQTKGFFTLSSAPRTLGRSFPGAGVDGAIQAGLEKLVATFLAKDFSRGQGLMRIDRLLVDMGYKPHLVAAVKHKAGGSAMMLSKGMGIRAGRQPMSTWKRKAGERHGHYWYVPNVSRTAEFPHVAADVNWWKTWVHTALAAPAGDRGSLLLFGKETEHEMFARQIADSEHWTDVTALGRTVREWAPKPSRPDNHWFDCLVGCAVAASLAGLHLPGEHSPRRRRKRYTQEDLRRRR